MCNAIQVSHEKDHIVFENRFTVPLDAITIEFPEYITGTIMPGTFDCFEELRILVWGINMIDRIEPNVIPATVSHLYLPPTYTHSTSVSKLSHRTTIGVHVSRINDEPIGHWFFVYGRDCITVDSNRFDNDTHNIYDTDDINLYGYFNKRVTVKRRSQVTKATHDASKYYISPGTFTLMLAESLEKKANLDAKLKREAEGIAHMLAIELHEILLKRVEDGLLASTNLTFSAQTCDPIILQQVQSILEETFPSITFKVIDWRIDVKKIVCSYSSPQPNETVLCH